MATGTLLIRLKVKSKLRAGDKDKDAANVELAELEATRGVKAMETRLIAVKAGATQTQEI